MIWVKVAVIVFVVALSVFGWALCRLAKMTDERDMWDRIGEEQRGRQW